MKKLFFVVGVAILLGVGGWLFLGQRGTSKPAVDSNVATTTKRDGVVVSKTDITKTGGSRIPQGIPRDIPVETANITESYKAFYEKIKATQYTVSYTSERNREVIWETYFDFMNNSGYTVNTGASSRSSGQVSGTKGDDSLSVIITTSNNISFVQLNYLDR